MMLARNKLGPLELEVMQAVWELKTATVREVYKAYYRGERDVVQSTVQSTMRNLERKGYLKHELEGITHRYSPAVPEDTVKKDILSNVLDKVFKGAAGQLVTALAQCTTLTEKDIEELRATVKASKQRRRRKQ